VVCQGVHQTAVVPGTQALAPQRPAVRVLPVDPALRGWRRRLRQWGPQR